MSTPATSNTYEQLCEIRSLLENHSGVLLERLSDEFPMRIAEYVAARQLGSPSDLLPLLRGSQAECDAVLERVLACDGRFFRHPLAFEALENKIIPEVRMRKFWDSPRRLRIWSAGCATGEEAYSIAMVAAGALDEAKGWEIQITATDLSHKALRDAQRGLYSQRALAGTPVRTLGAHFAKVGDHFLVKPELRQLVSFVPAHLSRAPLPGKFDAIFCMDVLPYLPESQRSAVVRALHDALEPGGYLLLSPGESLPRPAIKVLSHSFGAYRLYQKRPGRPGA